MIKQIWKIIIAGNGGIGKTSFLKKICNGEYFEDEILTKGSGIFRKDAKVNEKCLILQLWDLAGQTQFRFFLEDFLQGAKGAILGFDVKRRNSFLELKEWISLLRSYNSYLPIVLMGTKLDLGYHPTLNSDLATQLVEEFQLIDFVEISTKEEINIFLPFKKLISYIMDVDENMIEMLPIKEEII